jgi:hypothetical protein
MYNTNRIQFAQCTLWLSVWHCFFFFCRFSDVFFQPCSYPPAVLEGISPNSIDPGGGSTITVRGSFLGPDAATTATLYAWR